MKKIKKLIAQISRKQITKLLIVFLIFGFVFVANTYASNTGKVSITATLSYYINILLSILSWFWVVLATLAGKLMTNDLLYGSALHLDAVLRTLRNVMKNFANFALGFLLLFAIVKNIISPLEKDAGERKPIKIIQKTLIAGVLIQSSWFLMGVLVDLSTIATSAIGSFPSQFIVANADFQSNIKTNIASMSRNKIEFSPKDSNKIVKVTTRDDLDLNDEDNLSSMLNIITPNYDSLAGPLVFLGLSVFNFNEYESFGNVTTNTHLDDRGGLFLSLGLSGAMLIFFSIMMFFIFIFNLFRLIIIWIMIPLLPVAILLHVFKFTEKIPKGEGFDLSAILSIKNIVQIVIKPVIMVGALSLILVILVILKNVISGDKTQKLTFEDHGNVVIENVNIAGTNQYTTTMKSDGIFDFSISGVKDTFADIIVYIFGLFLMFLLVKISVSTKTGIGFIDDSLDKTFKSFQNILTSIPIIPLPGGGSVGISALKEANIKEAATRLAGINVADQHSRISDILGLGGTFSSLHTGMNRDAWIERAISTGKSLGYTDAGVMYSKEPEFSKKFDEWTSYYKDSKDKNFNLRDIQNVWDGKETEIKSYTKSGTEEKD